MFTHLENNGSKIKHTYSNSLQIVNWKLTLNWLSFWIESIFSSSQLKIDFELKVIDILRPEMKLKLYQFHVCWIFVMPEKDYEVYNIWDYWPLIFPFFLHCALLNLEKYTVIKKNIPTVSIDCGWSSVVRLTVDILPTSADVDQTEPAVPHWPQADSNSTSARLSLQGSTKAPFVGDSAAAEVTHHSDRGSPPTPHSPPPSTLTQRWCPSKPRTSLVSINKPQAAAHTHSHHHVKGSDMTV